MKPLELYKIIAETEKISPSKPVLKHEPLLATQMPVLKPELVLKPEFRTEPATIAQSKPEPPRVVTSRVKT